MLSQDTELNDGEVSPKSKEGIFWGVEDCGSESCGTGLAKRAANPNGLSISLTLEEIGVKSRGVEGICVVILDGVGVGAYLEGDVVMDGVRIEAADGLGKTKGESVALSLFLAALNGENLRWL